ncbi:hypothetical protein AURDEDRAFT_173665 [Auricularia subglabra TFB-10046 SS5]|nr:hypothetical protein AURDEDRAFT_173665 [Auricularia subglabra TFB-10046 SS5]
MVFRSAACDAILDNRPWVVQLALVSHATYQTLRPILFHTMVVTCKNCYKVERLMAANKDNSDHVFKYVRQLIVIGAVLRDMPDYQLEYFFQAVTSIDAPMQNVCAIAQSDKFRPRRLAVRWGWYAGFLDDFPQPALQGVTHLVGSFPALYFPEHALTPACVDIILSAMPALTHIGFELMDWESVSYADDFSADFDALPTSPADSSLDMDALEHVLRAVLQCPRIQVVALAVGADWLRLWPHILDLARSLRDARIHAWRDPRPMRFLADEAAHAEADAWARRDMWTEAKPISSLVD